MKDILNSRRKVKPSVVPFKVPRTRARLCMKLCQKTSDEVIAALIEQGGLQSLLDLMKVQDLQINSLRGMIGKALSSTDIRDEKFRKAMKSAVENWKMPKEFQPVSIRLKVLVVVLGLVSGFYMGVHL